MFPVGRNEWHVPSDAVLPVGRGKDRGPDPLARKEERELVATKTTAPVRKATVDSLSQDGHLGHIKSLILDQQDALRHQGLIRRLILARLTAGNLLIIAAIVALAYFQQSGNAIVLAGLLLVVSLGMGLWLYYRQYLRIREGELRLRKLQEVRKERLLEELEADDGASLLAVHKRYREDTADVVDAYRIEANKYRRVSNRLQAVIIIGSIVTSTLATASVVQEQFRWLTVVISVLVGISAGFTGYFKYRERSFNLQQTADAIEREYYSVVLRVGRYKGKTEADAYADFANAVEGLREEQNKRQQQLEQPPDVKTEQ
jgi:uncharacterized protein HemX